MYDGPKNNMCGIDPNRKWVFRDGKRYRETGLHEAGSRTRLKDMHQPTVQMMGETQYLVSASFVNDTAKTIWYAEKSTPCLISHIEKDGRIVGIVGGFR
jgi:hypothetical protein